MMHRVLVAACLLSAGVAAAAEPIDFDRDVRPILSDKCYQCHGPDGNTRKADLRLDVKEAALADRGGYWAIRPKQPDQSEVLQRIGATDPDERMPPPESKLVVTDQERQVLQRWIEEGATWKKHWAFETPVKPQPPKVKRTDWPKNPIDRFVLRRLEQQGLQPAARAGRETLIRRVTLDLTGLPPTPEETAAFLGDKSPDAYEKVVQRLLDSPAYGERMAWPWLDAARYADTDGFQGDPTRTMWPWRDWLVRALNDNMPFDQFTIEMLAGDLLPNATTEQILATGFNRNHMHNGEGGRIAEETRVENVFDRTETTATVWLGLTMTCCRCHDHKFDPMSQAEYFGLYAYFNETSENGQGRSGKTPPVLKYQPPEQREESQRLARQIADVQRQMRAPNEQLDAAQQTWESEAAAKLAKADSGDDLVLGEWSVLGPVPAPNGDGAKSFDHDFGPEKKLDLSAKYHDGKYTWKSGQKLADGQVHPLPETVGATYLARTIVAPTERTLAVSLGSDDAIKVWLNGKQLLAKNVARAAAPDQEQVQLALQAGDNQLLLKIVNTGGIAGFYFRKQAELVGGIPLDVAQALRTEPVKRNDAQRQKLQQYYRSHHWDQWKRLDQQQAALEKRRDAIEKNAAMVMVMDELPEGKRRETRLLFRGIYNKPEGDPITAGTPAFLPPLPKDAPRNRLALARWLVQPDHPLTARVTVNRYWQMFFGTGLVETSEDFGRQGSRPSHPELLDWLARQFIETGWDVKAMHKLMVTSATYCQSSRVTNGYEQDPENRLLARGSRYRMSSWMLRDQALAASGLLAKRMGGPSVKPYQPEGIWAEATFGKIRYQPDKGEGLYRRSVYVFWRRIVGPTMFFDSGKRQTCEVKPTRTNTPLHALTTLNETTFVEAARAMAQRVLQTPHKTPEERLQYAAMLVLARELTANELKLLKHRVETCRADFARHPEQAKELLAVGASPRDEKLDASEHAAYMVVCSLLLNLDEALTRE